MLSQSSTGVAVVDAQEDFLRASAMANETPAPDITRLTIRRNVALLAAAVAANASTLQLTSAVASISLARLLDVEGLLGLGPALVLAAGALAAVAAGRAMDRRGRISVLAAGFALGAASCGLAALGSADGSPVAVLAGLIGVGIANGPGRLIRTAGGDMYPPERRARGIAREEWRRTHRAARAREGTHPPCRRARADATQRANGAEYNFRWCDDPGDEGHGLSSFAFGDGVVYHVYSTYARGTDVFNTFYQLLDRAPKGRDEEALLRGEGEWWWRRHDEYAKDRA